MRLCQLHGSDLHCGAGGVYAGVYAEPVEPQKKHVREWGEQYETKNCGEKERHHCIDVGFDHMAGSSRRLIECFNDCCLYCFQSELHRMYANACAVFAECPEKYSSANPFLWAGAVFSNHAVLGSLLAVSPSPLG